MDKKEAFQHIIYKLKEIEGTRLRLSTAKAEAVDIEMALLAQQLVDVYGHVQSYRSGLVISAPATPQPKAEAAAPRQPEPAYTAPAPPPAPKPEPPKPAPVPEPAKSPELKRESNDNVQRKERLKRLEAEAARIEQARKAQPAPEPEPEPKGLTEDFTTYVEEKYQEAAIAEDARKASGIAAPEPVQHAPKNSHEQTLNERLQAGKKAPESLVEKFQQNDNKKTLAEKMKLGPISDLKSAIALNQKIAFTNELFGGDDKEFKKALNFINGSTNFSEAKFYLQSEVARLHNWDDNNPLVEEFMELVYRKFL